MITLPLTYSITIFFTPEHFGHHALLTSPLYDDEDKELILVTARTQHH
jgi:hypothetical protein